MCIKVAPLFSGQGTKEDLLYPHPSDNRVLRSATRIQAGGQQCIF